MMPSTDNSIAVANIRWMIRRDMPEVLGIEQANFEFPWQDEDFIKCLRQRNCIGLVLDDAPLPRRDGNYGRILGFVIYELHKNRLHILNFAVHAAMHRRGVGRALVQKMIGKLSPLRRNRLMLEIRDSNLDAQCFFRAMGFKAVSVLRDFYEDTSDDGYLFQYQLPREGTA